MSHAAVGPVNIRVAPRAKTQCRHPLHMRRTDSFSQSKQVRISCLACGKCLKNY